MQGLVKIYKTFGNGDIGKGKQILQELTEHIEYAREKYNKKQWKNLKILNAYHTLDKEVNDVKQAILHETSIKMHKELKDVIVIAIRMINKEYDK